MKKGLRVLYMSLIVVMFSGLSYGQNPEADKVGKLLGDLNALKAEIAQEQKVQEGLSADEKLLKSQDKAIKSIDAQYKKDLPVYERDLAAFKADWSSFQAGKDAQIAKWGCWDNCKIEEERWSEFSADSNAINTWLHRVQDSQKRIDAKQDELQKTFNLIKEGKETLSKATLEWAAKKKASNAKMNELIARYQALTGTYMDLIQRARLSEECKQIAYSNDRPMVVNGRVVGRQSGLDFNVLNGVMERAHRCLQKVWDGAK